MVLGLDTLISSENFDTISGNHFVAELTSSGFFFVLKATGQILWMRWQWAPTRMIWNSKNENRPENSVNSRPLNIGPKITHCKQKIRYWFLNLNRRDLFRDKFYIQVDDFASTFIVISSLCIGMNCKRSSNIFLLSINLYWFLKMERPNIS